MKSLKEKIAVSLAADIRGTMCFHIEGQIGLSVSDFILEDYYLNKSHSLLVFMEDFCKRRTRN